MLNTILTIAVLLSFFAGTAAQAASAQKSDFAQAVQLYQGGHYVQAASYLRTHISNSPRGNAPAYYYLANCYFQMGQLEDAQKFYRHCVELQPEATMKSYCQAAIATIAQRIRTSKAASVAAIHGVTAY
jgi:TolA-binding protein